jgi:hypothetical protein
LPHTALHRYKEKLLQVLLHSGALRRLSVSAELDVNLNFAAAFEIFRAELPAKRLKLLERVKGIEPSYSAWKAAALPLSYTRDFSDSKS